MSEAVVDDIVAVLPPLLNALEALGFFAAKPASAGLRLRDERDRRSRRGAANGTRGNRGMAGTIHRTA